MATLTRSHTEPAAFDDHLSLLTTSIPAPFPSLEERSHLLGDRPPAVQDHAHVGEESDPFADDVASTFHPVDQGEEKQHAAQDVIPSIAYVQKSCLTTLNDLLSTSSEWRSIVPDRRHSVPSSSTRAPTLDSMHPKYALQTLLANLRGRDSSSEMQQVSSLDDEAGMLHELQTRVYAIMPTLDADDAQLAGTLVTLLAQLHRVSFIGSAPASPPHPPNAWTEADIPPSGDVFDALTRQLSDFQSQRHAQADTNEEDIPPVLAVEKGLLWTSIDRNLETVLRLCRERTVLLHPRASMAIDLPEYDAAGYHHELPPGYEFESSNAHTSSDVKSPQTSSAAPQSAGTLSEKMRLDLDAVTMAIDRLYMVAPQLHNQRVELKSSKLAELERARLQGDSHYTPKYKSQDCSKAKGKEKELDKIVEMIGKASERKLADQTVILEGGMQAQLEKARHRDLQKRQAFVSKLAEHSDAGRMHAQDAVFQAAKPKDPEALLSLPEFMRESVPRSLQAPADPHTLLTLPEFVRESIPPENFVPAPVPAPSIRRSKSGKGLRARSMSAPGFDWLLSAGSRPGSAEGRTKRSSRPGSSSGRRSAPLDLNVHYVAEHHENLKHVIVFLNVTGGIAGATLEAEVLPSSMISNASLIIRSGSVVSLPLELPVTVAPGPQEVKVQGSHYEVKLSAPSDLPTDQTPIPLLDATQLHDHRPTSFICASCSLPLVQSGKITRYDDLPSEHWAELVEAWMCHTDQKLSAQVAKHGSGFWPRLGQALVGGSYILFEESAVMKSNLWVADQPKHGEDWRTVRCICGTFTGRCQDHVDASGERTKVFRLVKYALRPVSPASEPVRIPLSAFIVQDMVELAQAHATYRFVILDEEEERPRLLIWLFKPSMYLSYSAPIHYSIPKRGAIQAAKVLYKTVGPSMPYTDLPSLLSKFPGFPQAEQLLYPMEICQRLAHLLTESNACYPESMRTMTGLEVGWLFRA
ncbi:hypothetical protein DENSPDRAFT_838816 [Dentipellis sp. KUC8613]|nr:hypothetical protein DENSPDRAFT_838816 [Dentipellis sp. KUC8613]